MQETLLEKADALLGARDDRALGQLLHHADAAALAGLIEELPSGKRKVFTLLPPERQAEVILLLADAIREVLLPRLPSATIARFLHFNDEDDATDLLQLLPEKQRTQVLELLRGEKRGKIEKLLKFGSETAGGLMDLNFLIVHIEDTLQGIIAQIREQLRYQKQSPVVLVADEREHIVGTIPYRTILFREPQTRAVDVVQPVPVTLAATDREELIDLVTRGHRSEIICVTDEERRVLGVVRLPDLLKVAEEEATEDVYRFAGVDAEEDVMDSVATKIRRRSKWLIINLGTAFLAASVVALFQEEISRLALLAVYMPLVAGEGGNAATQALAVTVRGLAEGEIGWPRARRIITRETLAGMANGILMGGIAGGIALLVGGPVLLSVALAAALIINLFVAGLFGALVPFVLKRLRIDPATASSIFVTTATDVCGFLAFLGIGSFLLLQN